MSFVSYQPNTLSDQASYEEALTGTTSSQILLSREIADPNSTVTSPVLQTFVPVTSILESNSQHMITLGKAVTLTTANQSDGLTDLTACESRIPRIETPADLNSWNRT